MKTIILFALILFTFFACSKKQWEDLTGQVTVSGIVIITDTLSGTASYRVGNGLSVYLKKETAATSFLYSVKAGADGRYSFNGLNPDSSYTVYAGTDTGVGEYKGLINYASGRYADGQFDTLKLFNAGQRQNGLHLIVRNADASYAADITAWVYSSELSFKAGTQEGKLFDMTTNSNGVANIMDIRPSTYFLRIKTRSGNQDFKAEDTVIVYERGIRTKELILEKYVADSNGFKVSIRDEGDFPVNNAKLYSYLSRSVFNLDSSYSSSLYSDSSNATGIITRSDLSAGKYFLHVVKQVGTVKLTVSDSIIVNTNGISEKIVHLQ